jgi:cellulose synthase/poly-beta-1,6-N-acetylglucosamine synthase-like glycosyltransferase
MAETLFWTSFFLMVYAFAGYPALVGLLAAAKGKKPLSDTGYTPTVSILLSVYNEESVILAKMNNFLQLDYPPDKIELIVVSDGCTDNTEAIVDSFDIPQISLFIQNQRGGKTLALNCGAKEANGEILMFTDANSMFAPDAVQKLVRHFSDPAVGLVSGRSLYLDPQSRVEQSGGAYRRYEDFIKQQESRTVSIVGADGAIYAMRKTLYTPLPPQHINDFIHPMQVTAKGFRAIHEPGAVCTEVIDTDTAGEMNRQTRIMAQSWLIVFSQSPNLLKAGCFGYLWAILSHKVLRWLTLPLMVLLFIASIWLAKSSPVFQLALAAQLLFYFLTALGWNMSRGLLKIPAMFILLHTAAMFGLFKLATGQAYTTWNPRKK